MSIKTEMARADQWITDIMAGLSPAERARTARLIARDIKTSQARRIAAQKNPDGSAFAPRKKPKPKKAANAPMKFLYPSGGSGPPRVVLLKSWTKQGQLITGFDDERSEVRSFDRRKIIRNLPVEAKDRGPAKRRVAARSTIKSRLMFQKLRTGRFLRSGGNASEAYVGFTGRAAAVARVHQDGGFDRPREGGALVRYQRRRLLGLTEADDGVILHHLVAMVAKGDG
jgi:Phage virion morphogenesis family